MSSQFGPATLAPDQHSASSEIPNAPAPCLINFLA
jgi:hypothetical protein